MKTLPHHLLRVRLPCILLLLTPASDAGSPTNTLPAESIWTRDTISGDWSGYRDTLREQGIVTDFSATGYYDGTFSGGTSDDDFEFGGRADAFLHLNSGKLGLWDGGGFHVHAELRFGEATGRPAARSGGFWPVNTEVYGGFGSDS